jgi:ATP-binding cassette subfamily C exporter for protease/lipase/ATP-binding cassette subfamily C protein EexD
MKQVWRELRPLLGYMGLFSFCVNLLYLIPALFMLQVFDRVLTTHSRETLIVLLVGTALAMGLTLALDYVRQRLQGVLAAIADEQLARPLVESLVERAARTPHAVAGEGMRDLATLKTILSSNALAALFDAPWAPLFLALIWTFHPALGLGALASVAVMLALAWLNHRSSRAAIEGLQQDGRRAARYVESSLRNAEVLQALGMTDRLLGRWRALQDEVASLHASAGRSGVAFGALTRFVRQAIQIVMLALGAWLVISQEASAGIMIATTVLLGRALQPVEQLVGSWRALADGRAAYRRLAELDTGGGPQQVTLPCPAGRLQVEGLSYRVPSSGKPVLYNLSLSLEAGESLAIIGASAAGKSTLARLLIGVWAPATGSVRLDGTDVARWERAQLGQWIGYVPQDVELFDGSVADNIARLEQVDSERVIAAARRANAHEMIVEFSEGYDTLVGEGGLRLSPGQRQRIALARALYGNPRLVVLDEPNANLDGAGELALAHAVSGLRADGVTTIIVTHRPSLIAHVTKILILENGRAKRYGAAAEVMREMQRQAQAVVKTASVA